MTENPGPAMTDRGAPKLSSYLLLAVSCVIWGTTPVCGRVLVREVSPMLITGARFLCVGALLFAWLRLVRDSGAFRPRRRDLLRLAAMALLGIGLHNVLLFTALRITTAANTALIESIGPTFTTVLAFLFIGERLSPLGWAGILISCLGAVCIVSRGSPELLLELEFNYGDLLVVVCELMWSGYVVVSWGVSRAMSPLAVTAWTGLLGGLFCMAVGWGTGSLHYADGLDLRALSAFAYLVGASGILAYAAWNYAVSRVGATKAGAFIYLVPAAGALAGMLLLGEEVLPAQLAGCGIIILGMLVTVRARLRRRRRG